MATNVTDRASGRLVAPCAIDGCEKLAGVPGTARGWCTTHYQRWQRTGDPTQILRRRNFCVINECGAPVEARGWCIKHYTRWERHGSPIARMPGEVVDGRRVCPQCSEDKLLSDYAPTSTGACRACRTIAMRARRLAMAHCAPAAPRPRNPTAWARMAAGRAMRYGALVETFGDVEIFERDAWICQLCSDPIDPDVRHPSPLSASVDHIVPLSRGGKHERVNAQAAHLSCNVRKWAHRG